MTRLDKLSFTNFVLLPVFVLFFAMLFAILFSQYNAFASSPSFVRHEVKAHQLDWVFYDVNNHGKKERPLTEENIANLTGSTVGSIRSVSYVSDGKTLNATFWLTSPFNRSMPKNHSIQYSIYIDADSDKLTGWNGIDYIDRVDWNNSTQKWETIFSEKSDNSIGFRVLRQENYDINYQGRYVFISLDLHAINYPSQYRVIFLAEDYLTNRTSGDIIKVSDILDTVHIPTPKFILFTLPNLVTLGHGSQKSIELGLKSNNSITTIEGVPPSVYFYPGHTIGLNLAFNPNKTNMSSDGFATSELNMYSDDQLSSRTYTVPIYADISFPSELPLPISNTLVRLNPAATNNETFYLPITVEDWSEQLREWLGNWFNPISGVITVAVSVSSGIIGILWGRRGK